MAVRVTRLLDKSGAIYMIHTVSILTITTQLGAKTLINQQSFSFLYFSVFFNAQSQSRKGFLWANPVHLLTSRLTDLKSQLVS